MGTAPNNIAALRALVAARFPERTRAVAGFVATGVPAIDEALGGGLPTARVTELVSSGAGTGGQTVFSELLRATRRARQRVALIDGANGFVPEAVPADALRHLVWIRAHGADEAFAAADVVVRDGNYATVVIDLRGLAERALLKTPASVWHRLRHAAESGSAAVLVQTTTGLVPAVPYRLVLSAQLSLAQRRASRASLAKALAVEVERGRFEQLERSA